MDRQLKDVIELLPGYSAGRLDATQAEAVAALLTDYLDGGLDPEITALVDRAIAANTVLGEEVVSARRGKERLADLLPSLVEPLADPASPEIQQHVDRVLANKGPFDQERVLRARGH